MHSKSQLNIFDSQWSTGDTVCSLNMCMSHDRRGWLISEHVHDRRGLTAAPVALPLVALFLPVVGVPSVAILEHAALCCLLLCSRSNSWTNSPLSRLYLAIAIRAFFDTAASSSSLSASVSSHQSALSDHCGPPGQPKRLVGRVSQTVD